MKNGMQKIYSKKAIKKERAQVINPENIKATTTLIKKNRKKMSFKLKIKLFITLK